MCFHYSADSYLESTVYVDSDSHQLNIAQNLCNNYYWSEVGSARCIGQLLVTLAVKS